MAGKPDANTKPYEIDIESKSHTKTFYYQELSHESYHPISTCRLSFHMIDWLDH